MYDEKAVARNTGTAKTPATRDLRGSIGKGYRHILVFLGFLAMSCLWHSKGSVPSGDCGDFLSFREEEVNSASDESAAPVTCAKALSPHMRTSMNEKWLFTDHRRKRSLER